MPVYVALVLAMFYVLFWFVYCMIGIMTAIGNFEMVWPLRLLGILVHLVAACLFTSSMTKLCTFYSRDTIATRRGMLRAMDHLICAYIVTNIGFSMSELGSKNKGFLIA